MSGPGGSARRRERLLVLAGSLLVAAVAWSATSGQLSGDTKTDLYLDPWGFMGRALHLWDPQVTWGVLQNQGYGYLFPMGPFFGVTTAVLPAWVAQRLWWTLLLVGGFLAAHALLRALPVGTTATRVAAAVLWTLSPRVLTTLGGISSETLPVLLAPAILLPVLRAARGEMTPRRAAALSGLAVLGCGGVNATATVLAALPTGLFLLTRRRWWRHPLTGWWLLAAACASAWWLGPLLLLGRYSPPFLAWIEGSADVVQRLSAVDALRGSTHWLEHLVTAAGPWWPAGNALVTVPALVVATTLVAAAGLTGLGLRGLPERRWLLVTGAVGAVVLLVAHPGPVASPLAEQAQALFDGPLAPLRNVHKADPLVRLPLTVGLAHALAVAGRATARWRVRGRAVRPALAAAVVLVGVTAVSPGLTGEMAPPGAFRKVADQWVEVGDWLSDHAAEGRALVLPAASFGEYDWGRPMDEPLRSLSSVDLAVRDAVPLTPAGTIRFLDDVEHRLQAGQGLGGDADVLRRLGVRWLVVRNDLDAAVAGQPPVALARSAVRDSEGTQFVRGFGTTRLDASGERVWPVEVYDLGSSAPRAVVQDVGDVVSVAGGAEDLGAVREAGEQGLVVLDGDGVRGLTPGRRVVTDGYRARDRWYGTTRGRDATSTLTTAGVRGTTDYRPWPTTDLASTTTWRGIASVSASSSVAADLTLAGLRPAGRPAAALDDDPLTAWTTFGDDRPALTVSLAAPTSVASVHVEPLRRNGTRARTGIGLPTKVRVVTDGGSVEADLPVSGADVRLPAGATRSVRVVVLDTDDGDPGEVLTGLATVRLAGVTAVEQVSVPDGAGTAGAAAHPPADVVALDAGLPGSTACVRPRDDVVCLGGGALDPEGGRRMVRTLPDVGSGRMTASGTLVPQPRAAPRGTSAPGVAVEASSRRTDAPAGDPATVVDDDPRTAWSPAGGDFSPRLTVRLRQPVDVGGLRLVTRRDWVARLRPVVEVTLDGTTTTRRASRDGHLAVSGKGVRSMTLRFLLGSDAGSAAGLELAEVEVLGATLPRPAPSLDLPCGRGPSLVVDGQEVPTRATGPRSALWGEGTLAWTACGPVDLSGGGHVVRLDGVDGWQPATAVLRRAGTTTSPPPTATDVVRDGPTRLSGRVAVGSERVLALDANSNPGWEATLAGARLDPVVVDGFRQGFVLPDGAAGDLEVRFAPDTAYRAGLLVGLGLALLVPLALLLPAGRASRIAAARWRRGRAGPAVLVVLGAGLLGGAPGAGAAALGLAAAAWLPGVRRRPALTGGVLAAAGGVVAAAAVGFDIRGPASQATSTLLVILGAALVAAASVGPPSAWRAARRGAG
ncbi:DUF3367 domain-containing protein [Phycicoccus sp. HDW14]|uniref:alpha-(1->3)-arabinofuranosyltransferase domain-containing protein n=1 Tax=Phycicoccus sp. HDW14 TaxID=2714941 RepID=UPI0014094138|nr:alpha-(1->3)-arabinofuranosyltransferase family protein [Phycicoccus sp. HDW14]QIM20974.1 DUF3367 domain-containing protein [Phycicoccus sp. HDW14]